MTFIDRTNSSALQKKSRAVQEYLHVQKFQSKDENHFVPHCILFEIRNILVCLNNNIAIYGKN
jgi:enterochelin esterase-like enzyme